MAQFKIKIHKDGGIMETVCEEGMNLLELMREISVPIQSPCNGNGKCGKCRIKVSGQLQEPIARESLLLGRLAMDKGFRLACYTKVSSDMDIYLDEKEKEAVILTYAKERDTILDPAVSKKTVVLSPPSLFDQVDDTIRVLNEGIAFRNPENLGLIRELPAILRSDDYRITLVSFGGRLISVEAGDTTHSMYGLAVDIGTTTIAAFLYDLCDGRKVGVRSTLNPQKKFGADVITRIGYTAGSSEKLAEMQQTIVDCINGIITWFEKFNGISRNKIYYCTFAGNTTMMHFLMGLPAANISVAPFIPAQTSRMDIKASELGIDINPNGYITAFPSVAGYIGADTIAAVLSSGIYESEETCLLIDIGTNGEMVLGNRNWLYACSTAAGPAFEGANIRNGVGGVTGAIDKVFFGQNDISYTTIGNDKPIGLCGSGIVDVVAGMVTTGIIDYTGRMIDGDETGNIPEKLKERLIRIDGLASFLIIPAAVNAADMDIAITQKDVRELQNAKAAIAAGIRVIAKKAGISLSDVSRVYLAGGFGSYISIDSALKIGLLPEETRGRIESIGNAAGAGAVEGLLSYERLAITDELKKMIEYVELSSTPEFVDEYVNCMFFGEET